MSEENAERVRVEPTTENPVVRFRPVDPEEWQYKIRPECRGKAQEAVAQMRALGFRVELRRGDLLVFTIEHTVLDDRAGEILERVWPGWRDCVID